MAATEQGSTVARNYAEALLTLARRAEDPTGWGTMLRQLANAIESDATLRNFLDSPRIAGEAKSGVLSRALSDRVPRIFMRFVQMLVQNRRQSIIPRIANEYETLLDESRNIVHARVTVARPLGDDETKALTDSLSKTIGREVVPHIEVQPAILGGVVVRMGDVVMDGSLRRKLNGLKRRMAIKS